MKLVSGTVVDEEQDQTRGPRRHERRYTRSTSLKVYKYGQYREMKQKKTIVEVTL